MPSSSHLQQAARVASLSPALFLSLTHSLSLCISFCICMYTVGCLHATRRTKRMNEWVSVRTQTARLWSVCVSNTLTDEGVQTKIHAFNHQQQKSCSSHNRELWSQHPRYGCACVRVPVKQRHSAVLRTHFYLWRCARVCVWVRNSIWRTTHALNIEYDSIIYIWYTIRTWEKRWTCLCIQRCALVCICMCSVVSCQFLFKRAQEHRGKMSTIPMQCNVVTVPLALVYLITPMFTFFTFK